MGSFKRTVRRVRGAFDSAALIDICERPETEFADFGTVTDCGHGRFYVYQDNGADILAIAHLDTVQQDRRATVTETKSGSKLVLSGALDDRLGAYVILDLLPKLGIKTDWLLTVGEECADTTARDFVSDYLASGDRKQYRWMFQFDRTGTDAVLYDYETKETKRLAESAGFHVAQGLFSDISEMEDLGCSGFNFGVGYQDYHSPRAYAWLDDTFAQVARFVKFHRMYATLDMPHVAVSRWVEGQYEVTRKDGTKYTQHYRYKRTDADAAWDDDWEAMRDKYLVEHPATETTNGYHPMPGTLGYSDDECICGHIESFHEGNWGECSFAGCGCPSFIGVGLAKTQEAGLAGVPFGV